MITVKLDEHNAAILGKSADGLTVFIPASYAESVAQHVKLRMLIMRQLREYEPINAIDWLAHFSDKRLAPVLGTKIKSLISDTEGVESVDLSGAEYTLIPPKFSGICFTVDRENIEISI